mgnify:CR=1 FL=1
MPGSTEQSAPVMITCKHVPKNTEERNQKPQRNFCVECQMACCDECFIKTHKNHDQTNQQVLLINKIRSNLNLNGKHIKDVKSTKMRESLNKEHEAFLKSLKDRK